MSVPPATAGSGLTYDVVDPPAWLSGLSVREARLLDGALTFHCLVRPGQRVRATVLRPVEPDFPALTDETTSSIEWPDGRATVGSVLACATGVPTRDDVVPTDVVVDLGAAQVGYHLRGGGTEVSRLGTVRHAVRARVPVAFDALRQRRTDHIENRRASRPIPCTPRPVGGGAGARRGTRPAVLFGLHWLELGGAESWAMETVAMAREAGLLPIVVTDRPSGHPDIDRPAFDGALVIPLTTPMAEEHESRLLAELFTRFDIRGVHVHHCTWLYQRLPWIRTQYPDTQMVDSLHVLEWRTGGFVDIAVRLSDVMDEHHVISPQLRDYLVDRHGLPKEKVTLATLADLTVESRHDTAPDEPVPHAVTTPATPDRPLTIAFVGRFTQQKRPYLFLRLADRLHARFGDRVRFVMQGDGELGDEVRIDRDRLGLGEFVELRDSTRSVADTLAEADVLVLSSDNEGVTLTSFEADAHNVLVLSSDVGSQASVVAEELLCPRPPLAFLRAAEERLARLAEDPALAARLASKQHTRMQAFAALPRARDWTRSLYERWAS
ncbi:glycosyltransferase [Blastococcus sp. CT_GayMR19]|uniref:glycosyltransferase n=1 Tax=Blastococcus sp. CT_GayMR19 TaxID=2559608 RepID=UPI0010733D1B|nr:glycosyltransferase [Blastococcus sp. CT_GayMR19]TFV76118.1 glycosyltransferase [Blastococcus sp. CT_GayMR19]